MTTLAQIRSAWNTRIWQNASVLAITDKIYDYDITLESTFENSKLRYNQEVNAFIYIASLSERLGMMGTKYQTFTVEVRYYRKADVAGANHKVVLGTFEMLFGLVQTQLTHTWNSTVGSYVLQDGSPSVTQIDIEGVPVWLGTFNFIGTI